MEKNTLVNHPPDVPLPADNRPLVAPIYQSVKFSFDDTEETLRYLRGGREGFFYSRQANPTLKQLQLLLAQLQGRDDCLLTGSGVATIAASLLSLCKQGDHILAFVESYGPTRYIVQHLLAKFGVAHTLLSIEDLPGIERVLREVPTRLVVFESPTNPVTKIADIEHLMAHARRAGALTVLHNTFAGFHNHGAYDIDIFLHSLTKYASGHGDVMGGAIIARGELIAGVRKDIGPMGPAARPPPGLSDPARHAPLFPALRASVRQRARREPVPREPSASKEGSLPRLRQSPATSAGPAANERFRHRRHVRAGRRFRGGGPVCGSAAVFLDFGERGVDRISRDAAATAGRPRIQRGTACGFAGYAGHGAVVDRPRGRGGSDSGSGRGPR